MLWILRIMVDVEENMETGATILYVEKGIHITIQRYNDTL